MHDIEKIKIEKAIGFYMLANKLKYVMIDKKRSIADKYMVRWF